LRDVNAANVAIDLCRMYDSNRECIIKPTTSIGTRSGHWERKNVKIAFCSLASSKVDRFTSNQDKNDHRPTCSKCCNSVLFGDQYWSWYDEM